MNGRIRKPGGRFGNHFCLLNEIALEKVSARQIGTQSVPSIASGTGRCHTQ